MNVFTRDDVTRRHERVVTTAPAEIDFGVVSTMLDLRAIFS